MQLSPHNSQLGVSSTLRSKTLEIFKLTTLVNHMKFYGTILILLVSFTASALAQNTSEVISKDDELRLPTSWEDYISLKRQLRAFGSFESSGVTTQCH